MNFCLYKLKFTTAIHIGGDSGSGGLGSSESIIHSDTFFSALCIEALKNNDIDRLYESVNENKLVFSSMFPYKDEEYFLPKPILMLETSVKEGVDYKSFKKLKFIPASSFGKYLESLRGGDIYDAKTALTAFDGVLNHSVRANVALKGLEKSEPYHIGAANFSDDSGLYFILSYKDEKHLSFIDSLINQLSYSGIGGKRSSGMGKFIVEDVIHLDAPYNEGLENIAKMLGGEHKFYLNSSISLPEDDELDNSVESGYFSLVRRGGFIQSSTFADTPVKKDVIYAFGEGSCFESRYNGYIADVGRNGEHPVYRCLKPLFLGVDL